MKKAGEQDYNRIKKTLIKKLYSCKAFRKGHLLIETLQSGLPSHLIGYVKFALKELVKDGLIVCYGKTKHGLAYQLNIKKLKEIEQIIFDIT